MHCALYAYCICVGHTPPCAVEQLPVPRNSSVNCKTVNAVLECKLKCHHMFKFGSSQNVSIQNCNDGVWDYQRDEIHIPDCQRECIHLSFQCRTMHIYAVVYLHYIII